MEDKEFETTMTAKEKEAWDAFKEVVSKFLGNYKDPDYKTIVMNMLEKFQAMGCSMSVKIHFLHTHVDFSPEILGSVSEEQGEMFHQNIKDMERKYQARWDKHMLALRLNIKEEHQKEVSKKKEYVLKYKLFFLSVYTFLKFSCIHTYYLFFLVNRLFYVSYLNKNK